MTKSFIDNRLVDFNLGNVNYFDKDFVINWEFKGCVELFFSSIRCYLLFSIRSFVYLQNFPTNNYSPYQNCN